MSAFKKLVACIFGPNVYSFTKIEGHSLASKTPDVLTTSHKYQPNTIEVFPDYVVRFTKILVGFTPYFSMFLFSYVFYKKYSSDPVEVQTYLKLAASVLSIYVASLCLRGYGRYKNPDYLSFMSVLEASRKNLTPTNKRYISHIDFDFDQYPIDFSWWDAKNKKIPVSHEESFPVPNSRYRVVSALPDSMLKTVVEFIGTLIMKAVGKRIVYPGTMGFLKSLMDPAIVAGRKKLVDEHEGVRYKLLTYKGDQIDSFFIDKRNPAPNSNGNYLVIGCEGNGGFYEIGTILTPLEAGYSVLGWNHPGFGGSTGFPYPDNEVAAVDTVVSFALERLSYPIDKIIIYGWSIGGFTASWAAMRYPNINGLIIDASFDHIIPLASKVMPSIFSVLVELAIEKNFDLNNSRHLEHYNGPVLVVRRSQDEVISLDPYNSPQTNRANDLLIHLLEQRFPKLMDARGKRLVREFCGGNARYQHAFLTRYGVNSRNCLDLLASYLQLSPKSYPVEIGPQLDNVTREKLILFLASKHLLDYDSVHCAPLPPSYFQRPCNLINLALDSRL